MRALVFGETGQVARELRASAAARGIEATFLGRAAADLADPEACARAVARRRRRHRPQRRRPHRRSTAPRTSRPSPRRSTPPPRPPWRPPPPRAGCRSCTLHRLRLRRRPRPALARGRPDPPAQHLRREQAPRRAAGGGGEPGPRDPAHRLGLLGARAELRADHALGRPRPRRDARRRRPARRPDLGRRHRRDALDHRRRLDRGARAGQGSSTTPARPRSAGPSSPRRSSPAAAGPRARRSCRSPRTNGRPRRRRPANSVLDCAAIAAAYGIAQPDWRPALDARDRRARGGGHERRARGSSSPAGRAPGSTRSPTRCRSSCCRSTTSR